MSVVIKYGIPINAGSQTFFTSTLFINHHYVFMISILSPSKTQDFADDRLDISKINYTEPILLQESGILIRELRKKSVKAIEKLMSVSENIATLNHERFQHFSTPFSPENARQALLAFKGDVYTDIAIHEYKKADFDFAQKHLCILSGLYGLLKPLDLIQPYRLEMKTKLKNPKGKDLYQFWGGKITKQLNEILKEQKTKVLINLASNEYFKAIKPAELEADIITPVFKEQKNGTYKTIALYAKRARGMMANFIICQRIDTPEKLKTFAEAGYEYSEHLSSEKEWVFIR